MAAANGNGNHPRRTARPCWARPATSATPRTSSHGSPVRYRNGADSQARALDTALLGVNQLASSLRDTSSQAESVASSAESLVSSINEMAASITQVSTQHGQPDRHHPRRGRIHPGKPRLYPERQQPDAGHGRHRAAGQHIDGRDGGVGAIRDRGHRLAGLGGQRDRGLDRGNHPVDSGSGRRAPRTSPLPRNRPPRRSARRPLRSRK